MTTTADDRSPDAAVPLAPLLGDSLVGWDVLHERYGALLELVDTVLGVVPNCDRYLEIWPPAFRTYNIMVPNFLNLPVPVLGLGGPPPGVVGLAMYVASRTAECPYCSAHSCSFAMRRGAAPETVAAALLPDHASLGRGELATIAVARSLARIPCELTAAERTELLDVYGERNAEWIVLGAVMMGFLNKFMDAVGVELEQSVVAEVSGTMGPDWSPGKAGALLDPAIPARPAPPVDGWRTRLRLLPLLPAAMRFDRRWQRGVPSRWPAVGGFLRERTGHDFPVLARLHSPRVRRSLASMLRENLDPTSSAVGIDVKVLAGAVFAEIVRDEHLADDVRALARHGGVDRRRLDAAAAVARGEDPQLPCHDRRASAALTLARAASHSPARIDATTVAACRDSGLPAAAIVEIVTWLSVLQMLHRLTCFAVVAD
jgi:alkylhydroperoxidase family enzyme